jgi:hypothetical protein
MDQKRITKLPWIVYEDTIDEEIKIIRQEKTRLLGRVEVADVHDQGQDYGRSNAEFIVEACNSYYSLKEENERLRALLKDSKQTLYAAKVEIDENEYKEPWDKEPTLFCIRETLKKIENL